MRAAVEGETVVRTSEIDELSKRVQDISCKMEKEIVKKANKKDVEKALYLKVDKYDNWFLDVSLYIA